MRRTTTLRRRKLTARRFLTLQPPRATPLPSSRRRRTVASKLMGEDLTERRGARQAAKKFIMYHGTSSKLLKKILTQGFVPSPTHKVWAEDPNSGPHTPSRVSYGGTYFTRNMATARSAGNRAARKFGGETAIVIAQIQPRAALPDEDDLTSVPRGALEVINPGYITTDYAIVEAWAFRNMHNTTFRKQYDRQLKNYSEGFIQWLKDRKAYGPLMDNPHIQAGIHKMLPSIYHAELDRRVAYFDRAWLERELSRLADEEASEIIMTGSEPGEKVDRALSRRIAAKGLEIALKKVLSVGEAEANFRDRIKLLSALLKSAAIPHGGFEDNLRLTMPIKFSGANKIVAAVVIPKEGPFRVVYGKVPGEAQSDLDRSIGDRGYVQTPGAVRYDERSLRRRATDLTEAVLPVQQYLRQSLFPQLRRNTRGAYDNVAKGVITTVSELLLHLQSSVLARPITSQPTATPPPYETRAGAVNTVEATVVYRTVLRVRGKKVGALRKPVLQGKVSPLRLNSPFSSGAQIAVSIIVDLNEAYLQKLLSGDYISPKGKQVMRRLWERLQEAIEETVGHEFVHTLQVQREGGKGRTGTVHGAQLVRRYVNNPHELMAYARDFTQQLKDRYPTSPTLAAAMQAAKQDKRKYTHALWPGYQRYLKRMEQVSEPRQFQQSKKRLLKMMAQYWEMNESTLDEVIQPKAMDMPELASRMRTAARKLVDVYQLWYPDGRNGFDTTEYLLGDDHKVKYIRSLEWRWRAGKLTSAALDAGRTAMDMTYYTNVGALSALKDLVGELGLVNLRDKDEYTRTMQQLAEYAAALETALRAAMSPSSGYSEEEQAEFQEIANKHIQAVQLTRTAVEQMRTFITRYLAALEHAGHTVNFDDMTFTLTGYRGVDPHPPGPTFGKVETLYRGDIFARRFADKPELFRRFYAKRRRNFGGGSFKGRVSTTYNKRIAIDFARMFKVLWQIVHGQVTLDQILSWADRAGVGEKLREYVRKDRINHADMAGVMSAYSYYIHLAEPRRNPVMWGIEDYIPLLKKVQYRDIGVMVLTVDMDRAGIVRGAGRRGGTDEFYAAESEYRITPEAVTGIRVLEAGVAEQAPELEEGAKQPTASMRSFARKVMQWMQTVGQTSSAEWHKERISGVVDFGRPMGQHKVHVQFDTVEKKHIKGHAFGQVYVDTPVEGEATVYFATIPYGNERGAMTAEYQDALLHELVHLMDPKVWREDLNRRRTAQAKQWLSQRWRSRAGLATRDEWWDEMVPRVHSVEVDAYLSTAADIRLRYWKRSKATRQVVLKDIRALSRGRFPKRGPAAQYTSDVEQLYFREMPEEYRRYLKFLFKLADANFPETGAKQESGPPSLRRRLCEQELPATRELWRSDWDEMLGLADDTIRLTNSGFFRWIRTFDALIHLIHGNGNFFHRTGDFLALDFDPQEFRKFLNLKSGYRMDAPADQDDRLAYIITHYPDHLNGYDRRYGSMLTSQVGMWLDIAKSYAKELAGAERRFRLGQDLPSRREAVEEARTPTSVPTFPMKAIANVYGLLLAWAFINKAADSMLQPSSPEGWEYGDPRKMLQKMNVDQLARPHMQAIGKFLRWWNPQVMALRFGANEPDLPTDPLALLQRGDEIEKADDIHDLLRAYFSLSAEARASVQERMLRSLRNVIEMSLVRSDKRLPTLMRKVKWFKGEPGEFYRHGGRVGLWLLALSTKRLLASRHVKPYDFVQWMASETPEDFQAALNYMYVALGDRMKTLLDWKEILMSSYYLQGTAGVLKEKKDQILRKFVTEKWGIQAGDVDEQLIKLSVALSRMTRTTQYNDVTSVSDLIYAARTINMVSLYEPRLLDSRAIWQELTAQIPVNELKALIKRDKRVGYALLMAFPVLTPQVKKMGLGKIPPELRLRISDMVRQMWRRGTFNLLLHTAMLDLLREYPEETISPSAEVELFSSTPGGGRKRLLMSIGAPIPPQSYKGLARLSRDPYPNKWEADPEDDEPTAVHYVNWAYTYRDKYPGLFELTLERMLPFSSMESQGSSDATFTSTLLYWLGTSQSDAADRFRKALRAWKEFTSWWGLMEPVVFLLAKKDPDKFNEMARTIVGPGYVPSTPTAPQEGSLRRRGATTLTEQDKIPRRPALRTDWNKMIRLADETVKASGTGFFRWMTVFDSLIHLIHNNGNFFHRENDFLALDFDPDEFRKFLNIKSGYNMDTPPNRDAQLKNIITHYPTQLGHFETRYGSMLDAQIGMWLDIAKSYAKELAGAERRFRLAQNLPRQQEAATPAPSGVQSFPMKAVANLYGLLLAWAFINKAAESMLQPSSQEGWDYGDPRQMLQKMNVDQLARPHMQKIAKYLRWWTPQVIALRFDIRTSDRARDPASAIFRKTLRDVSTKALLATYFAAKTPEARKALGAGGLTELQVARELGNRSPRWTLPPGAAFVSKLEVSSWLTFGGPTAIKAVCQRADQIFRDNVLSPDDLLTSLATGHPTTEQFGDGLKILHKALGDKMKTLWNWEEIVNSVRYFPDQKYIPVVREFVTQQLKLKLSSTDNWLFVPRLAEGLRLVTGFGKFRIAATAYDLWDIAKKSGREMYAHLGETPQAVWERLVGEVSSAEIKAAVQADARIGEAIVMVVPQLLSKLQELVPGFQLSAQARVAAEDAVAYTLKMDTFLLTKNGKAAVVQMVKNMLEVYGAEIFHKLSDTGQTGLTIPTLQTLANFGVAPRRSAFLASIKNDASNSFKGTYQRESVYASNAPRLIILAATYPSAMPGFYEAAVETFCAHARIEQLRWVANSSSRLATELLRLLRGARVAALRGLVANPAQNTVDDQELAKITQTIATGTQAESSPLSEKYGWDILILKRYLAGGAMDDSLYNYRYHFLQWDGSEKVLHRAKVTKAAYEALLDTDTDDEGEKIIAKVGNAMTAEEREAFFKEYLLGADPAGGPSYAHLDNPQLFTRQTWLVHFSDDAEQIRYHGFKYGTDAMDRLGLTTWMAKESKKYGGFNFAFQADGRYASAAARQRKYGSDAVMFQSAGIEAYHYGDAEQQVMFYGRDVDPDDIVLLRRDGSEWLVVSRWKDIGPFKSFDDAEEWVRRNFLQYRRQITGTWRPKGQRKRSEVQRSATPSETLRRKLPPGQMLAEVSVEDLYPKAFQEFLAKYKRANKRGLYIRFASAPSVTVSKIHSRNPTHADPWGVYAYPLDYAIKYPADLWYGSGAKYLQVLRDKSSRKLLMQEIREVQAERELYRLGFERPDLLLRLIQYRWKREGALRWAKNMLTAIQLDFPRDWRTKLPLVRDKLEAGVDIPVRNGNDQRKLFLQMGYDALEDTATSHTKAVINAREPQQIVFLRPSAYEVVELFELRPQTEPERAYAGTVLYPSKSHPKLAGRLMQVLKDSIRTTEAGVERTAFWTKKGRKLVISTPKPSNYYAGLEFGDKLHRRHTTYTSEPTEVTIQTEYGVIEASWDGSASFAKIAAEVAKEWRKISSGERDPEWQPTTKEAEDEAEQQAARERVLEKEKAAYLASKSMYDKRRRQLYQLASLLGLSPRQPTGPGAIVALYGLSNVVWNDVSVSGKAIDPTPPESSEYSRGDWIRFVVHSVAAALPEQGKNMTWDNAVAAFIKQKKAKKEAFLRRSWRRVLG